MYKIGVIGPADRVMCFKAAGFEIYDARTAEEAEAALKTARKADCAIIYIVPDLAEQIAESIKRLAKDTLPAVIPLPEAGGGYGITQLKGAVERAVGADIIFKEV